MPTKAVGLENNLENKNKNKNKNENKRKHNPYFKPMCVMEKTNLLAIPGLSDDFQLFYHVVGFRPIDFFLTNGMVPDQFD